MGERLRLASIEDVQAIEAIPLAERVVESSVYEMFASRARRQPDRTAIRYIEDVRRPDKFVSLSYGALLRKIVAAANLFRDLGGAAPTVSIIAPNLIDNLVCVLAAHAVGKTSLVNNLLEPAHIAHICQAVEADILVAAGADASPEVHSRAMAARAQMRRQPHVVELGAADENSLSSRTAGFRDDGITRGPRPSLADIATYFHTGGTTSTPKIAPLTHRNETYTAWAQATVAGVTEDDVVLSGMPWFHGGGLFINTLSPLCAGAQVVVLGALGYRDRSVYAHFWEILETHQATYFLGVPTVFQALSEHASRGRDLSSLRLAACGGAPLSVELIKSFERETGVAIHEGYGMTEAGVSSFRNPRDGERRIGSVGIRFPYQGVRIAQISQDGVRDCAVGETGTVLLAGPNIFPGYLQKQLNVNLWVDENWLNSGDLGRLDVDGYLWLTGREKDLIIRGGHNIDPAQIEEVFYRHPDVLAAAAVGKPDAYSGEKPVLYVSLRAGAQATCESLLAFGRAEIGEKAAIPSEILIWDELPTTAVGKLLKRALVEDAARREFAKAILEAGVTEADVEAISGGTGRTKAIVTLRDGCSEQLIRKALSPYTVDVDFVAAPAGHGRPAQSSR